MLGGNKGTIKDKPDPMSSLATLLQDCSSSSSASPSTQRWGFLQAVRVEVHMGLRQAFFFVDGVQQPFFLANLPDRVRVGVWSGASGVVVHQESFRQVEVPRARPQPSHVCWYWGGKDGLDTFENLMPEKPENIPSPLQSRREGAERPQLSVQASSPSRPPPRPSSSSSSALAAGRRAVPEAIEVSGKDAVWHESNNRMLFIRRVVSEGCWRVTLALHQGTEKKRKMWRPIVGFTLASRTPAQLAMEAKRLRRPLQRIRVRDFERQLDALDELAGKRMEMKGAEGGGGGDAEEQNESDPFAFDDLDDEFDEEAGEEEEEEEEGGSTGEDAEQRLAASYSSLLSTKFFEDPSATPQQKEALKPFEKQYSHMKKHQVGPTVTATPNAKNRTSFGNNEVSVGLQWSGRLWTESGCFAGNAAFETDPDGNAQVAMEVDMSRHVLVFIYNGRTQPVYVSDLPDSIQFGVGFGAAGSWCRIVRFEQLAHSSIVLDSEPGARRAGPGAVVLSSSAAVVFNQQQAIRGFEPLQHTRWQLTDARDRVLWLKEERGTILSRVTMSSTQALFVTFSVRFVGCQACSPSSSSSSAPRAKTWARLAEADYALPLLGLCESPRTCSSSTPLGLGQDSGKSIAFSLSGAVWLNGKGMQVTEEKKAKKEGEEASGEEATITLCVDTKSRELFLISNSTIIVRVTNIPARSQFGVCLETVKAVGEITDFDISSFNPYPSAPHPTTIDWEAGI